MKRVRNIIIKSLIGSFLIVFTACNSWLDITPVGVQTSDTYWKTKDEAEQVLMSSYIQLRECLPSFFKWGEIRSNALAFGSSHDLATDQVTEDERSIRRLDIKPSNSLTSWSNLYVAIGRANHVIKYTSGVMETDMTLSPALANSIIAEAVFIRSLCYFYLVRTFRDVPYVTDPFADDSKTFLDSITEGTFILDQLVKDMKEWAPKSKPGYEGSAWQVKGRATTWAYYALLADVYLWQGNYVGVEQMYQLLNIGGFALAEPDDYFKIFYPGNHPEESIFELQFRGDDDMTGQGNSLYEWFSTGNSDGRYVIDEESMDIIDQDVGASEDEIRGETGMYNNIYTALKYFKYVATERRDPVGYGENTQTYDMRPEKEREPNWIFYRFAEIILMRAEAMVMTGESNAEVCAFLDETTRKRAGLKTELSVPMGQRAMLELILDERLKELMAEGKRWFDILRVSRINNYEYLDILITEVLKKVPVKDRDMWELRLQDEYGHYLPISKREIEASYGNLPQNPFYKNIE